MSRRSYTPLGLHSQASNILPLNSSDVSIDIPLSGTRAPFESTTNYRSGLPRSSVGSIGSIGSNSMHNSFRLPIAIRRILRPPTLDFETAIWELFYLIVAPRRVYKSLYYHKQTKNTWARDDPSFSILLSGFLILSALAWGLAYSPGFLSILRLMLYMVLVDFLATGIIIATVLWVLVGKFLKSSSSGKRGGGVMSFGTEGELEWAYCFDIHCNAFLIIWLCLYVIQFIMLPLLTRNNWISLFLGNTLYLFALSYYCIISFYGYSTLPFLEHTEILLLPIPIMVVSIMRLHHVSFLSTPSFCYSPVLIRSYTFSAYSVSTWFNSWSVYISVETGYHGKDVV